MANKWGGRLIETIYDDIASVYEDLYSSEHNKKVIESENAILKKLMNHHYDGKDVLDAGCGTGFLIDLLGLKENGYVGYDISNKMIEQARKKYPKHKFVKMDFMESNLLNSYDFLFSIFSVSDYVDYDFIYKAYDVLRNNGIFMSTFINADNPFTMECLKKTGHEYELTKYTYNQLRHYLSNSNFIWYYIVEIPDLLNIRPHPYDEFVSYAKVTEVIDMEANIRNPLKPAKYFFVIAEKDETQLKS